MDGRRDEIDTLLKYDRNNTVAIDYRKKRINSQLTLLTLNKGKIKELEQKVTNQNRRIAAAEKRLLKMESLLGPSPQKWIKDGNRYLFDTGVVYQGQTQDLIFPKSDRKRTIKVSLLSASYSLEGAKKDEVQAYVSLTQGSKFKMEQPVVEEPIVVDTSLIFYYHPDAIQPVSPLWPDTIGGQFLRDYKQVRINLRALTAEGPLEGCHYSNRQREFVLPRTLNARQRKTLLNLHAHQDTLLIEVLAHADPVPTRLSKVSPRIKQALGVSRCLAANNNYLKAIRAVCLVKMLLEAGVFAQLVDVDIQADDFKLTTTERQIIESILGPE